MTHLQSAIEALTNKEREALEAAIAPIYFADNSDYIRGLWNVVRALIGDAVQSEKDIKDCLYLLSPELRADEGRANG